MSFAIKAEIQDAGAARWSFVGQKTMYGGERIANGDSTYVGKALLMFGMPTTRRDDADSPEFT